MNATYLKAAIYSALLLTWGSAPIYHPTSGREDERTLPGLEWTRSFGDNDNSYQNKIASVDTTTNSLILAGTYFKSKKGHSQRQIAGIWIWRIDPVGERTGEVQIESLPGKSQDRVSAVEALHALNNQIFVAVRGQSKRVSLLSIDLDNDDTARSWELPRGVHVSRILKGKEQKILLLGHHSQDSIMLLVDDDNNSIRTIQREDHGKSDLFVDGLIDGNRIVTVENSGKLEQFFMGASQVIVSIFDQSLTKTTQIEFEGRYGQIVDFTDKKYSVLFDRSSTARQEVHLKCLNANLEELWDTRIFVTNFGLEQFKFSVTDGRYIIVGAPEGKVLAAGVSSTGEVAWRVRESGNNVLIGADVISVGLDAYLLGTVVQLNEQQKANNKIRVSRFVP